MVVLCGNFAKGNLNIVNGQVTKTRNLLQLLDKDKFDKVKIIDTSYCKIINFLKIIFLFLRCRIFMLCVSRGGTKRIVPLINFLKFFKKNVKTIYFCVGTCPLPRLYHKGYVLNKREQIVGKRLKKFDFVCPETETMRNELEKVFGLKNLSVFKNFQLNKEVINISENKRHGRFVFFSRISHEKNIETVFQAIDTIKAEKGFDVEIDFYGPIEDSVKNFFNDQIKKHDNCRYFGIIDSKKSITVLSNYEALVFTTKCLEGTPGAIVDSAFANVPIISQPFWASSELIQNTNIGCVFDNIGDGILHFLNLSQLEKDRLKNNCFIFAKSYDTESALKDLRLLIEK